MILISGEALIDLIPDPIKAGAYDAVLGGSPYNVAIGLARLGLANGFRLAHFRRREWRSARRGARRERRRPRLRRARQASDHARVRHARDRQDGIALFVLPRCDGFRRPVAVPDRMAQGRAPLACRLDRRGRPTPRAVRRRRIDGRAPARDGQLRSQYSPARDPRPRAGDGSRRARRFRSRIWSRRARKISSGSIPTPNRGQPCRLVEVRPEILCRDARGARRARHARQGAGRGRRAARRGGRHRRRGRQFHVRAPVGDGSRPCARRRGARPSRSELEKWLRFAATASAITCTRKGSDPPARGEVEAALAR